MHRRLQFHHVLWIIFVFILSVLVTGVSSTIFAQENPQSGSVGLTGLVEGPPPDTAAVIISPADGSDFSETLINVNGTCQSNMLIRLLNNGVFTGSAVCHEGEFSLTISLLPGTNQLIAQTFDALNRQGPDSQVVSVTFSGPFVASPSNADPLILISNFISRGANPGQELSWPIGIQGGVAPYAMVWNWGDGAEDLFSVAASGEFNAAHTYEAAGSYPVTIKATDAEGRVAFLQVVSIINGAGDVITTPVTTDDSSGGTSISLWVIYTLAGLVLVSFFLGVNYEKRHLLVAEHFVIKHDR